MTFLTIVSAKIIRREERRMIEDCVFVIMIASLLGACILAIWSFAWSLLEETEIGQLVIKKIKSWFGMDEE